MAVREILRWPDPRLSEVCAPVGSVDAEARELTDDLLATMYTAPGRGLAAPQIGVMRRAFAMDCDWKTGVARPQVFLDPEILWRSGETEPSREGCLSIPGILVPVVRASAIRLAWTGLDGRRHEARLEGAEAICAQHETDHLDGIVTLDRTDPALRPGLEAEFAGTTA